MLATPTSRPRPPAKRRQRTSSSAATQNSSTKGSPRERRRLDSITSLNSPPPAYASTLPTMDNELVVPDEFPETLLGSPVPSSFRFAPLEPPAQDWADEKSREELAELLVKAEDIIKERENELGMAAAVAKSLHESNISLKTKHEAFLRRLPLSPPQQLHPPEHIHTPSRSNSYSSTHSQNSNHMYEASPTPSSPSASPSPAPPPFYRQHGRRVSMSTTEISLLADQNAELMDKLQQLESESSSADQAGRRELKRLENEIASLREMLEKTHAKSQELEEKTKGLDKGIDKVVEDAWKRKRDREMRIQALRSSGSSTPSRVRDFAPRGSMLGQYPFPRPMSLAEFGDEDDGDLPLDEDETLTNDKASLFPQLEQDIVKKLLKKVQELEETNTRILKQQQETAMQLQAVQRDTEQMNRVYDCLGDPQEVEIEVEDEDHCMEWGVLSSNASRFKDPSSTLTPSRNGKIKNWKSPAEDPYLQRSAPTLERHRSSYSLGSGGLASPALSTLSLLNSPGVNHNDLSPIGPAQTLDAELANHFGGSWDGDRSSFSHLRTHSLSNLSQWSAPLSPSPSSDPHLPGSVSNVPVVIEPSPFPTPPSVPQPPLSSTPDKQRLRPSASGNSLRIQDQYPGGQLHPGAKSPRQVFISQRIRDRRARWEDERFGSLSSISSSVWADGSMLGSRRPEPVFVPPLASLRPKAKRSASQLRRALVANASAGAGPSGSAGALISTIASTRHNHAAPRRVKSIVDSLVSQFDVSANDLLDVPRPRLGPRHTSPDLDSGYEESSEGEFCDEGGVSDGGFGDSSFETTEYEDEREGETEENDSEDGDGDADEQELRTPQIAEENALQLQMNTKPSPRVTFLNSPGNRSSSSKGSAGDAAKRKAGAAAAAAAPTPGGKWGNILLELWLWLQFAVIIFVFLYTMAKRGPKAVFVDQDAAASRRTRKSSLHVTRH